MALEQQEENSNFLNSIKSSNEHNKSFNPPLFEPEISISSTSTLRNDESLGTGKHTDILTPVAATTDISISENNRTEEENTLGEMAISTNEIQQINEYFVQEPVEDHWCAENRMSSGSSCDRNDLSSSNEQFCCCLNKNMQSNNNGNCLDSSCAEFCTQQMAMQMRMGMQMPPDMGLGMQMNPAIFMANNSYPMQQHNVDNAFYQGARYSNYAQKQPQTMADYNNYVQRQMSGAEAYCNCNQSPSSCYYSERHLCDPNSGCCGAASSSSCDYCACDLGSDNSHTGPIKDEHPAAAAAAAATPRAFEIQDLGSDSSYTGPFQDEPPAAATGRTQCNTFDIPESTDIHHSVDRPSSGEARFMGSAGKPLSMSGLECPMSCPQPSLNGCMPMNCSSYPFPPCLQIPCSLAYPNNCSASNNCLDVESFVRNAQAAQQQPNLYCDPNYANYCSQMDARCCCDNDKIQSQTVYSTDYKPCGGPGNNFDHFPNRPNFGSFGCNDSCYNFTGPVGCGICNAEGPPDCGMSQMCSGYCPQNYLPSGCCSTMPPPGWSYGMPCQSNVMMPPSPYCSIPSASPCHSPYQTVLNAPCTMPCHAPFPAPCQAAPFDSNQYCSCSNINSKP